MPFKKSTAGFAIGVVLLLFGVTFSQPSNLYTFSSEVEITEAPPGDGSLLLFQSSGLHYTGYRRDTVYVVWAETRTSTPPTGNHVFFAKSTDGGQTFGPNVRVNSTPSGFNPSMRVDTAGIIYIAYERQGDIFFTKSTDGGITFTPAMNVIDPFGLSFTQGLPSIAVNNKGQTFICWTDTRTNPQSIFTTASYDGGQTFGQNVQASVPGFYSRYSDIGADDSGKVYVIWEEFTDPMKLPVRLARSDDSGGTFSHRTVVSDLPVDTNQVYALMPSAAVENGGRIGVVWVDRRFEQYTLHFSSSSDYGQTFSPSVRVDDDTVLTCCPNPGAASLVLRGRIFYVVFGDHRTPPGGSFPAGGVYFTYSTDGGASFMPNFNITAADTAAVPAGGGSFSFNEAGKVFMTWLDGRYDTPCCNIPHIFGMAGAPNYVKGDLNLDGMLTALDVVVEINAAFLGQTFPAPYGSADVNCDSRLTGVDVVLLVNATFLGRSFPCSLSIFTEGSCYAV